MLYFLCYSYEPNTATYNRMLAYWQNLDIMEVPAKLIFLMPGKNKCKIEKEFKLIEVEYCWENYYIDNRYLKYFSYYLYKFQLIRRLRAGDKVCIFGLEKISRDILKKRGVELYLESTECPEVYGKLNRIVYSMVPGYIDCCRKSTALFVISSALKEYYMGYGVSAQKIHILNMTVDPERFVNVKRNNSAEKYIAYCGNVSNNKDGVDKLIKSFAIVSKNHSEVKLYIIGESLSKAEVSDNYQLIQELGIKDKIVFTGRVSAAQMPQLLKDAQVLVLARPRNIQAKYGFPTKLGEYLMTENPVVVTSVGDIPLFLEDGVSALIASPDNDQEFAQKIIWAIDHPNESAEIGRRGKEVALKSFNASIETKKLIDVIFHK